MFQGSAARRVDRNLNDEKAIIIIINNNNNNNNK
jgi:hypothetical protein